MRRHALDPALADGGRAPGEFVEGLGAEALSATGLRREDKGPIQALHWRGAMDEESGGGRGT